MTQDRGKLPIPSDRTLGAKCRLPTRVSKDFVRTDNLAIAQPDTIIPRSFSRVGHQWVALKKLYWHTQAESMPVYTFLISNRRTLPTSQNTEQREQVD
ncbi:hypothetical protein H6F96_15675 [Microcoleus sp. FACHB-53]|nr:hypothetical protein [Microcoleus sp. FACHB-53]